MGIKHSKTRQQSMSMDSTPNLSRSCSTVNSITEEQQQQEEEEWLTNTHFVLKHYFGDNFSAPVHDLLSKPTTRQLSRRVLDVACGFGVWVLEMASNYPNTEFYGVDVVPMYPNTIKPPNALFQQCDILEGFPYPDEFFDYIHMRLVCNCFSASDLEYVLAEMNRVLKPGGYIEIRDIDPIIKNAGPITDTLFSNFESRTCKDRSIDVTWTRRSGEILKNELALADVHCQYVSIGLDGALDSVNCSFIDTIKSYRNHFMATLDMTEEEYEDILDSIIQECSKYRSYFQFYMCWGRKPLIPKNLIAPGLVKVQEQDELLAYDILHLTRGFTD